SSAIFADLLGGSGAGRFTVAPARGGLLPLGQRYRPGTMTVETRWSGLTVTDYLDANDGEGSNGYFDTLVRVLTGSSRARLEFAPRPEFGQVPIGLQPLGEG